ncbi:hypothetical protein TNCV_2119021 [Trichonephila clavipes]|nr:hypothetical protein TNCV_2119021 [Trichonephila clavipes]
MCIEPGDYTVQAMECFDKQRLLRAKYYCLEKTKEVRKEKRLKRKKEDDELLKNADDLEYGAGIGFRLPLTMEHFRTTFTLIDNSHPQRRRTVRTEEAIATVKRSIEEARMSPFAIEHRNWICVHPLYE